MAYAILQKNLTPPDVELLKRAFHVVPGFRDIDAHNAAHEAYGVFLRGLDVESASALQDALLREGFETSVVAEAELPTIPPAHVVRQIECHPQHVVMFDPLRRSFTVPWRDVLFIAAGNVRLQELKRVRTVHESPAFSGSGINDDLVSGTKSRTEMHYHLVLDVFLSDGVTRYNILADEFVYDHLGARMSASLKMNFALLVQDLVRFAPHAGLNRGAYLLSQEAAEIFTYPSKTAFVAEMTWMLWKIGRLARREEI